MQSHSSPHSLYDAPAREVYLLENVSVQGRKTELRQLLKLLNFAKTGQPKAALITGDAGIGKTAVLEAFAQLVREGVYCRILDLGKMSCRTAEELYIAFIEHLQAEADAILDEALIAVNEITRELDLRWERQDLARAIALVKLQESIGGKEAISQEQLVKAIRSQVPAIKKLKFSVNDSIEKLVDLIVNPWVMVATSILNPMSLQLQEAIRLASTLKTGTSPAETAKNANGIQPQPLRLDSQPDAPTEQAEHTLAHTIIDLDAVSGEADFKPFPAVPEIYAGNAAASAPLARLDASGRAIGSERPIKDPLIRHLMTVFNFINTSLESIDSALLILIDEWDRILDAEQPQALKDFLSELLFHITEQKNYHFMVAMTCRTEGESYTLGGSLYNQFRTKLLLDALNENTCRKLVRSRLKEIGVDMDEDVYGQMAVLSRGNPYWHLKTLAYLRERVESSRLRHVDGLFFEKLGIETLDQLLELSFTQLKLAFLNDEESLYKVIAALLKQFGEQPFSANQAIREISASQGFTDGYVFEVLRAMFRHDFIREANAPAERPPSESASEERLLPDLSRRDPHYVIHSRFVLAFLLEKTHAIETDISTDEKLIYLKKIIPLSVRSAELDREKTMEVLSLSEAMGKPEIIAFLEDVFIESLRDAAPVVRVTALNNVALIDSEKARDALFQAMKDEDSIVREYAVRNLAIISQKSAGDAALSSRVVDAMLQAIDDESEAVRAQVYGTLARYSRQQELVNVFVKGLSDACEAVRITSARSLSDVETESPLVFGTLMDAMDDSIAEVRRYACLGLQRFPGTEAIDAIVRMLQTDVDSIIRALAADSLSRMPDPRAFRALVDALRNEASEDARLAVARALGKRRGWQTEDVLLEAVQNAMGNDEIERMPVFVWACIRSLGMVGGTERSRNLLAEMQRKVYNPIILSALAQALQQIDERIGELRQMERQLEDATPVAVAMPSEYDEDIAVPEEELPDVDLSDEMPQHAASLYEMARDDVPGEGDDVDERLMREAEMAQLELNAISTSRGPVPINLPFERHNNR